MQGYAHIGIMMDSDTAGEYMGNMRGIGENILSWYYFSHMVMSCRMTNIDFDSTHPRVCQCNKGQKDYAFWKVLRMKTYRGCVQTKVQ